MRETYTQADGRALYRWTDAEGQVWVCCEYDHGPFCRRCIKADETMVALIETVIDGQMTVKPMPANQPSNDLLFHVTEEGMRRAQHLIETVVGDPVIDAVRDALEAEDDSRTEGTSA